MNPVLDKRASIVDIAKASGVSHTTVSFVLNRRPGKTISEPTRVRVLQAAAALGYSPNIAARSLRQCRTNMVATWIGSIRYAIFAKAVDHIDREARKRQYMMIMGETNARGNDAVPKMTEQWPVDGIIAYDRPQETRLYLESSVVRKPIVSIGPMVYEAADYVKIDLYSGCVEALEFLIGQGCRRIAILGLGIAEHDRSRAYTDVLRRAGLRPEVIVNEKHDRPSVRQPLMLHIEQYGLPDALFCWNDEMAIAANCVLRDLGVRVPEQVMIVGVDGIDELEYHSPTLTSIEFPLEEMCSLAWDFLETRMSNPEHPHQTAVIKPKLVLRQSTAR